MSYASEDIQKFVLLVEQHTDVLLKSQTSSNKEKKEAAAVSIIQNWEEISKIKLTNTSLLKKISNLKTRAKAIQKSGKPMIEWQVKILGIMNDDEELDAQSSISNQVGNHAIDDTSLETPSAEQILSQFETDQTKSMSIEQLQRFVLLQKVHVLTLQRKRLEYLNNIENGKNVTIDYIGFDDGLINDGQTVDATLGNT